MELTDIQRLAVAEAMGKAIKDMTNPRGGAHGAPTLRTECDDALRQMYEAEGVDRKRIVINGTEVGTLSARLSKPESGTRVSMSDTGEFVRWLRESDGGFDALWRLVTSSKTNQAVIDAATADGELPDGCRVEDYERPATWLGTTLRISVPKVGAALGAELPSAVMGLLGGGQE
ncbi:hypothetical protein [Thermophilibacter provencensis]|uniref:Uncharacterized protein n=1 Tax=Thermophilibacter provencensis TaxID=1852386 RepID=A0ABT7V282_9ACTN|nr:hypothetical protein [Thermophilibacter provencensis]MDM8270581.1 hypothetical protein [Thermophilibacter provencensis]